MCLGGSRHSVRFGVSIRLSRKEEKGRGDEEKREWSVDSVEGKRGRTSLKSRRCHQYWLLYWVGRYPRGVKGSLSTVYQVHTVTILSLLKELLSHVRKCEEMYDFEGKRKDMGYDKIRKCSFQSEHVRIQQ